MFQWKHTFSYRGCWENHFKRILEQWRLTRSSQVQINARNGVSAVLHVIIFLCWNSKNEIRMSRFYFFTVPWFEKPLRFFSPSKSFLLTCLTRQIWQTHPSLSWKYFWCRILSCSETELAAWWGTVCLKLSNLPSGVFLRSLWFLFPCGFSCSPTGY